MIGAFLSSFLRSSINSSSRNSMNSNVINNDKVQIQLQDTTGNWRTYHVTVNLSQNILAEMKNLQRRFPNNRIRAVDEDGRLVDIL